MKSQPIVVLLLALAVAGCGAESSTSDSTVSAVDTTTATVGGDPTTTTSSSTPIPPPPIEPDSATTGSASTTQTPTTTTTTTTTTMTTDPPASTGPATEVEQAVADLAAAIEVDPTAVEVVRFERVTWRDGALGCPEPDRAYTQALVDGFRIELSADGETFWYHGGRSGVPFLCENPQAPAEGGGGGADT